MKSPLGKRHDLLSVYQAYPVNFCLPFCIFWCQVSLYRRCGWLYHRGLVLRQLNWRTRIFNSCEPNLTEVLILLLGEAVAEEYAEDSQRVSSGHLVPCAK